jgi:hypothetical protein
MALFAGLQPLTLLVRALAALALVGAATAVGLRLDSLVGPGPATGRELHAPRALASLFERPGLAVRGARLAQLAWVPLIVAVFAVVWSR